MLTYLIPALVLLLFIAAFILFRTALFSSAEEAVEPLPPADVDSHTVAEHLGRSGALPDHLLAGGEPV